MLKMGLNQALLGDFSWDPLDIPAMLEWVVLHCPSAVHDDNYVIGGYRYDHLRFGDMREAVMFKLRWHNA